MNASAATEADGLRRELVTSVVLIVFGGLVVVGARRIPLGVPTDLLGPRAFPTALGAGIVGCGVLLALATLIFRGQHASTALLTEGDPDEDAEAGPASPIRFAGAVLATALYLVAFVPVGYLISTPLYVLAIMLVHGGASRRALWLAPIVATVALYATFRFGLLIPIPQGVLEGILPW